MRKYFIRLAAAVLIAAAVLFFTNALFNKLSYGIYDYKHIENDPEYFDFSVKDASGISDDFIKENTAVIIRSVGERTEQASIELLSEFFGRENIILIRNITPLRSAVEISYEIALKKNKKWTLILDPDILIMQERLKNFLKFAELLSKKYDDIYSVSAFMISKFRKEPYITGVNLFYTENLPKALKYLKESNMLKIEEYVKAKMSHDNLLSYRLHYVIGLADFFQYYRDILRKSIVFCYKWRNAERKTAFWKTSSFFDKEFQYAIEGCKIRNEAQFQLYSSYDSVDSSRLNEYIDRLISENKIKIERQKPLKLKEALNAVKYFKFDEEDSVTIDRTRARYVYENGRYITF